MRKFTLLAELEPGHQANWVVIRDINTPVLLRVDNSVLAWYLDRCRFVRGELRHLESCVAYGDYRYAAGYVVASLCHKDPVVRAKFLRWRGDLRSEFWGGQWTEMALCRFLLKSGVKWREIPKKTLEELCGCDY